MFSSALCSLCFISGKTELEFMWYVPPTIISLDLNPDKFFKEVTFALSLPLLVKLPDSFCYPLKIKSFKSDWKHKCHRAKYKHFSKRKNLGYVNYTKFRMCLVRTVAADLLFSVTSEFTGDSSINMADDISTFTDHLHARIHFTAKIRGPNLKRE